MKHLILILSAIMLLASCGRVKEKAKETINKDFNSSVTAKTFDKSGLEAGRAKIDITGKADEAGYFDFVFDKRTKIEAKSKIIIE